jgi:tetratricopeptide (TPR) repeat protein
MRWILSLSLVAAVAATFAAGLPGDFVYDDRLLIQRNPALQSLANLPIFFSSGYWDFTAPDYASRIGYWRPLAATALSVGHALADGAPFGFRLLSLLVHAAASLAAFALARRLGLAPVAAALAASVFALHPIQAEAVAWPSAITDPLLALLCFLALERHAAWRQHGSRGWPIPTAMLLTAALLTKETGALLLLALPAHDVLFGEARAAARPWRRPAIIAGGVVALYLGLRMAVFGEWTGGIGRTTTELGLDFSRRQLLRVEILGDALGALWAPVDLRVFRPIDPQRGWLEAQTLLELGAIALTVGVGCWAWRRGRALVAFGAVLALAPLLPLISRLESLGQYPVTDRYLVVPALGLGLILAGIAEALPRRALARGALACLALLLARGAHERVPIWLDEESLFAAAVEETPESALPHWSYGRVLLERFGRQRVKEQALLEAALAEFEAAQGIGLAARDGLEHALVSSYDLLQANLGLAQCYLEAAPLEGYDDYDTPRTIYEMVLDSHPRSSEAWEGLGRVAFETDDLEGARRAFERALDLDPTAAGAQKGIGIVHYFAGKMELSRRAFEALLELRSGEIDDLLWASRAAIDGGRIDRAEEWLERARVLDPEDPSVHVLLSVVDYRRRDPAAALQHADDAIALDPEDALAHNERAKALLALGDEDEALFALRRACDFGPELFEPHNNVAAILIGRGAFDAAIPYLDRAYRLCPDPGLRSNMRGQLVSAVRGNGAALLALAAVDAGRRDLEPALYWSDLALEAAPDDLETLLTAARLRRRVSDLDTALIHLRVADDLFPERFGVVRELALCLVEAGRLDEARAELARALELVPDAERLPGGDAMRAQLVGELEQTLDALPLGPSLAPSTGPDPGGSGGSGGSGAR